jgi:hypothetical protein
MLLTHACVLDVDKYNRVMMFAEVHGNNQGISKLYRPQDMGYNPKAGPLKFENETKISVGECDLLDMCM